MAAKLGMKTTVGAYCFAQEKAKENAEVIRQLLEKGVILLGTANLSLCGGSSSGSGVGVSAGFVPMSLGTETGGSLVYPASKAGLYAMRPTLGSVSAKGIFRISETYDGVGAMARTPLDLSILVEAILTPEYVPAGGFGKYMTKSWEVLKIGLVGCTWGMSSQENKDKWASDFVYGGHVIYPTTPPEPSTLKFGELTLRDIAYHEFNEVIQKFCDGFENPKIRTAKDIIKFNEEHAEKAMPEHQCDHTRSEIGRLAGKDGMEKYMTEHDLDLIVLSSDCSLISFISCAGYPSATVPLGNLENGQQYGLIILATSHREDLMFRFMSAFEATFPKVKRPELA